MVVWGYVFLLTFIKYFFLICCLVYRLFFIDIVFTMFSILLNNDSIVIKWLFIKFFLCVIYIRYNIYIIKLDKLYILSIVLGFSI